MENLYAIRDAAFWWLGVWTLCTGVDIAVWRCIRRRHLERRGKPQFYDWSSEPDESEPEDTQSESETETATDTEGSNG